jgi:FkbM family methyltransferase
MVHVDRPFQATTYSTRMRESVKRISWRVLVPVGLAIRAVPNRHVQLALADLVVRALRPQGSVTARLHAGFRMHLSVGDRFQAQMYVLRTYEPAATRLIEKLLKPGDTFVDGGANIGYFTLLGAVRVGAAGVVHCFEPVPVTVAALDANIVLNGFANVLRNQVALGESTAQLSLEVPLDKRTGTAAYWGATTVRMQRGASVNVAACTLDEYSAEKGLTNIKLVKLDLEGGEAAAVRGMHRLLSSHAIRYLVCECNPFLLGAAGLTFEVLQQDLAAVGYRCFRLDHSGNPHLLEAPIESTDMAVTDYLFTAPSTNTEQGGTR